MRLFTEASPVETVLFTPPTSAYMKPASAATTVTTVTTVPMIHIVSGLIPDERYTSAGRDLQPGPSPDIEREAPNRTPKAGRRSGRYQLILAGRSGTRIAREIGPEEPRQARPPTSAFPPL